MWMRGVVYCGKNVVCDRQGLFLRYIFFLCADASATVCDAQATATLLRALASQHLPQVTAKYSRLLGELVSGPDTEKLIKELEAALKQ
jgi:hypothetical protein